MNAGDASEATRIFPKTISARSGRSRITPDTNRAILKHLDGSHLFDLNVEYFIGMPSWVAAGDPPYGIWMTHTPQGSINRNLSGVDKRIPACRANFPQMQDYRC